MHPKEAVIYVRVDRKDIDILNKILEGYEGLALVTTIDAKEGIVQLTTFSGLKASLLEVLKIIPRKIEIITKV